MTPEDRKFIIQQFRSTECACGKRKDKNRAFCYKCYTSLPKEKRRSLWEVFGRGFEEAYDDCVAWLEDTW